MPSSAHYWDKLTDQYKTSGVTTALGSTFVDPKFNDNPDVSTIPNTVNPPQLFNLDLHLSSSSTVPNYIGSQTVRSVAELMSQNQ